MTATYAFFRRYPILSIGIVAIVGYVVFYLSSLQAVSKWIAIITVLAVIITTAIDMMRDIMRGNFGLDILALIAMIATLSVGEYLASLIIVLMLSGGEALEDYAERRASKELTDLLDKTPKTAHVFESRKSDSEIRDVPVEEVKPGDILLVRPSEIVPVDGKLLTNSASFDESSITGESIPVTHEAGSEILSGSLNGQTAVTIEALRSSANSQYQQIIALVAEAQNSRAPVVRLADRFAVPFTLVSLLIAGLAWWISGDPVRFAQVLVLATPCPLLIAAPVAFLGGLSRAAKAGVVLKGGSVIESMANVKSVAFDKTGTLTRGEPALVSILPEEGFTEDEIFLYAASAEQYSSHVLAEGIVNSWNKTGKPLLTANTASEEATNGVVAEFDFGTVVVGKISFVQKQDPNAKEATLLPGHLAAYVSVNGQFAGTVILADEVRPESLPLIKWLKSNGISISILTGDAKQTADSVAAELGIEEVHSTLLPSDKVSLIKKAKPAPVMMVGDGVNDAPVLAAADVGIAMGARGSTAAGEAADSVILQDSLVGVAQAISISKSTLSIALQAIWIGIALSVGLMLVASTGVIPAVVGAFIQEIVDLVAILYALRTLRGRPVSLQI